MWFKYGLKAQKLLAQGIALGIMAISKAPCKGKSFVYCPYFKAFALTGRQGCVRNYPGRCPGLGASALSGRVGLTCESSERDRKKAKARFRITDWLSLFLILRTCKFSVIILQGTDP